VSPLTFLKASATGAAVGSTTTRLVSTRCRSNPEEMAKIPVTTEPELRLGRTVPLGDAAEITFSHPPLIGDAFVNGGDGLLLVLEKFPSASVPEVTRGVEEASSELARGLPGVKIDTSVFRLASYIEDLLANLAGALFAGAILPRAGRGYVAPKLAQRDRPRGSHPTFADERRDGVVHGGRHAQYDDSGGLSSRWPSSSTMRSSTSTP
jgi:hypothetical protein